MQVSEPLRVGGVTIEEVDCACVSDDDVRRYNTFENVLSAESHPEDPPTPIEVTTPWLRHIPELVRRRDFWASRDDGAIVASANVHWMIGKTNQHIIRPWISVRAEYRRRRIATALLGLVADVAETVGRRLLVATTSDRIPAGESFARQVGADVALEQHINRLILAEVDRDLVDRWIEEGPRRAEGYSLIPIDGAYPDDLVESAVNVGMVMNTAPRGDLDAEDEQWTVEDARDRERYMAKMGTERWSLFARHDDSGEVVGFTEVGWNAKEPETVWQWGTGVRPEHRGHALGKWLKAAMLRRILSERPSVDVRTGNADSNDAMLGINRALGFRPFHSDVMWQVDIERVRAYLDGSSV
jgi:GNAT superfamily N-acetyltransferase